MTATRPTGTSSITPNAPRAPGCPCIGPDQEAAWRRLADFVHAQTDAKICAQIGHAGRKGSTRLTREGIDQPLATGKGPLMAASSLPYLPESQTPQAMDSVQAQFIGTVRTADRAGFDMVEMHAAEWLSAGLLNLDRDQSAGRRL